MYDHDVALFQITLATCYYSHHHHWLITSAHVMCLLPSCNYATIMQISRHKIYVMPEFQPPSTFYFEWINKTKHDSFHETKTTTKTANLKTKIKTTTSLKILTQVQFGHLIPQHIHTQLFYGPFSGTNRVSRCQKRNFWTLWCKGRLTEADTPTIRRGATPSRPTSTHLHHPFHFFTGWMPFPPPNQQCQSTEGN